MNKLTLCALSVIISTSTFATELPLLKQKDNVQTTNVGFVELDGVRYEKVVVGNAVKAKQSSINSFARTLVAQPGLYQGDMLKRGKLSRIERISGNLYISSNDASAINELAKMHNLDVSYNQGNKAILKAPQGKELVSLLKALKADKRIKMANLERISNKMQPE